MKLYLTLLTIACWLIGGQRACSQTINWGDAMFSDLVNSKGQALDSSYKVEIGAFATNFVPDNANVSQWATYWRAFDGTTINGIETPSDGISGYFSSSVQMLAGGTSSNTAYSSLGLNFQDLPGYLWIHNGTDPQPGTEWLLARASTWTFPTYHGCCGNTPPVDWSVSNLAATNAVPVFGKQGDLSGAGVATDTGSHTLQTFTLVPEPSAGLLVALAGLCLVLRRQRDP